MGQLTSVLEANQRFAAVSGHVYDVRTGTLREVAPAE